MARMANDVLVPKQDRPCPDNYTETEGRCSKNDGTVMAFPACLKKGATGALEMLPCSAYEQVKLPGEDALQAKGAQTFAAMFPSCQGITMQGLVQWLNGFPANQREYVAFNTARDLLSQCRISDCTLWDALELSLGVYVDHRPDGCPRSVQVSRAICSEGACRLPGLGEIKCWWLYALGGAVAGGLATWVATRYRKYRSRPAGPATSA
jgi:hypothetical protein